MAQKARVFSSSRNGKRTSLHHGEGGFAMANPRPLISSFLVHCGERGLCSGKVLCCDEGGLHSGEVLRRDEGDLRSGEPVTHCDAAFSLFLIMLYFSFF